MSTTEQAGRPGKYRRSAFGLVVALATTVVAIVFVMWVMSLFRHTTDIKPQHVAYKAAVADAQEGGLKPVYPVTLPSGYFATQAQVPDDGDGFEIDLLKGTKDFIGIRVAHDAVVSQLVHDDVDGLLFGHESPSISRVRPDALGRTSEQLAGSPLV